jgi:uncharacterized damage-inducible protein DinB
MTPYDFLLDTYDTERLKTLATWAAFGDGDLGFRPEPRARTPLEHMVHQCVSEETWMQAMLGVEAGLPALPPREGRRDFIEHYAEASSRRLARLREREATWFAGETTFFDVPRPRAWVLTRRIAHSAHHRGQLVAYLRLLGRALHSTYGPTADTGGLFQHRAPVIYRHASLEALLDAVRRGDDAGAPLPGPGALPVTERP